MLTLLFIYHFDYYNNPEWFIQSIHLKKNTKKSISCALLSFRAQDIVDDLPIQLFVIFVTVINL